MSRTYSRRVDANHSEIVNALRKIGVHAIDLSRAGGGIPDLCCFWRGQTVWIEIKNGAKSPSRRSLTVAQQWFHDAAKAGDVTIHVCKDISEALALFGATEVC